ncbi:MAG: hypothetical protein RJS97_01775 [Parvibaculaceae bacterium]
MSRLSSATVIVYDQLQLRVLFENLLQLAELLRLKATILLRPSIICLLGNPHLTDLVGHRHPHLSLLESRYYLVCGIALFVGVACLRLTGFLLLGNPLES